MLGSLDMLDEEEFEFRPSGKPFPDSGPAAFGGFPESDDASQCGEACENRAEVNG